MKKCPACNLDHSVHRGTHCPGPSSAVQVPSFTEVRVCYLLDGRHEWLSGAVIAHVVQAELRGGLRTITPSQILGCKRMQLRTLTLGDEALVEDPRCLQPGLAATDHVRVVGFR